jgi:hypothetical protein
LKPSSSPADFGGFASIFRGVHATEYVKEEVVEEAYTQQGRAHIRRLHPDWAARPALMSRAAHAVEVVDFWSCAMLSGPWRAVPRLAGPPPGAGSGAALLARVRQCAPRDCDLLPAPPVSTHASRVTSCRRRGGAATLGPHPLGRVGRTGRCFVFVCFFTAELSRSSAPRAAL